MSLNNIKPEDALDQIRFLKELTQQTAIRISCGYPFYILWGLIWIIGYVGEALLPISFKGYIWPIVCPIGGIGTAIIFNRMKDRISTPLSKKLWAMNLVLGIAAT